MVGNFLCKYFGCHHVLWTHRKEFLDYLMFIILEDPVERKPFQYFSFVFESVTPTTYRLTPQDLVYYDSNCVDHHRCEKAISLPLEQNACRGSQFLEDNGKNHSDLDSCDDALNKKLKKLSDEIDNAAQLLKAREELEAKMNGTYWCSIL